MIAHSVSPERREELLRAMEGQPDDQAVLFIVGWGPPEITCGELRSLLTSGWQLIDTAPKDGTDVVLLGSLPGDTRVRACVSRWWFDPSSYPYLEGWLFSAPGYQDRFVATHWMPKP